MVELLVQLRYERESSSRNVTLGLFNRGSPQVLRRQRDVAEMSSTEISRMQPQRIRVITLAETLRFRCGCEALVTDSSPNFRHSAVWSTRLTCYDNLLSSPARPLCHPSSVASQNAEDVRRYVIKHVVASAGVLES